MPSPLLLRRRSALVCVGQRRSVQLLQRQPRVTFSDIVLARIHLLHGLAAKHASPNGDLLSVQLSVRQAEALLSARYYEHVHAVSNTTAHRVVGG